MFNTFETATMEGLINAGKKLNVSHSKIHFKAGATKPDGTQLVVNYYSLIDRYRDFINKILVKYTMTEEEFIKYRYQPKKMCLDFYGTTELWGALLRVNNMHSCTQFNKETIKMFTHDIEDVLTEILILEEDAMLDALLLAQQKKK